MMRNRCPARAKRRGRSRSRHGAASPSPKPTSRAAPHGRAVGWWRWRRQQFRRRVDRYRLGLRQHQHVDRRRHQWQDHFRGRFGNHQRRRRQPRRRRLQRRHRHQHRPHVRPHRLRNVSNIGRLHGHAHLGETVKQLLVCRDWEHLPMRNAIRCSIGIGLLSLVMSTVLGPVTAFAQGSAGGSIGNDEKSLSGSREAPRAVEKPGTAQQAGSRRAAPRITEKRGRWRWRRQFRWRVDRSVLSAAIAGAAAATLSLCSSGKILGKNVQGTVSPNGAVVWDIQR